MVIKLLKILLRVFGIMSVSLFMATILVGVFVFGYLNGRINAISELATDGVVYEKVFVPGEEKVVVRQVTPPPAALPNWTGPELWEAVNKRRLELGVNALGSKAELCTIAAIRLNELLELERLDGHEGFSKLTEEREDLRWIFEKYNMSEFLVSGANTPAEAVSLWENTLGHKQLLTGGEYVWGCIYGQAGFGVAIAAY